MDRLSLFSCEDLQKMIENGSSSMNTFNSERSDSEQLDSNYEGNWLEKKMWKRKPKPRVVSLTEKLVKTAQTDDASDPGKVNYDEGMIEYEILVDGRHSIIEGTEMLPTTEEFIFKNFKVDLADFGVQETYSQYVCCTCLLKDPSGCSERYQLLAGVFEQRLLEPLLHQHKLVLSATCFLVRTGNTYLGSLLWVDYVRLVGLQKAHDVASVSQHIIELSAIVFKRGDRFPEFSRFKKFIWLVFLR